MAENQKPASEKRKRRVRTVETVREQQAKRRQVKESEKPSRVRSVLRWIGTPFRRIASLKIWRSPALKPVRFIVKIIGYVLFVPYLKSSWKELRQVILARLETKLATHVGGTCFFSIFRSYRSRSRLWARQIFQETHS